MKLKKTYLDELARRKKESRIYRNYQLEGLEIATLLKDEAHRSLYIKLAKEMDSKTLLRVAKEVKENKNINNKGAYFMWLLHSEDSPISPKKSFRKK